MIKKLFYLVVLISLFFSKIVFAETNFQTFDTVFSNWTNAFNHRDLNGSCDLFSKSVVADYQGSHKKNYTMICNGFKKIFQSKNERYEYRYKIHDIYRADLYTTVRITWYLKYYRNNKLQYVVQDEGMDVLQKEINGQWKIINYLGYPATSGESV